MDCDKNQTQGNRPAGEQTGSQPDNGKADVMKQDDGKRTGRRLSGIYALDLSVAKPALGKNRQAAADLERRRAIISNKLEEARKLLAELRSRLESAPEFDEDDLAEYRETSEACVGDLGEESTRSEAEEDEDQEYEDIVYQDCEYEDPEDDEDWEALLGLETLTESLHEDSCSGSDDIEATEETNSNLDANSDEDSDSDPEVNLIKGKGVEADFSMNDECF